MCWRVFISNAFLALLRFTTQRYQVFACVTSSHKRLEEIFHLIVSFLFSEHGNLYGEVFTRSCHDVNFTLHAKKHW